ncbi:MAG: class I SAM-dependent methyltransferase [Opitutaceae bacterium]
MKFAKQMPANRNRSAYDQWSEMYDLDPNPHTAMEEDDVVDMVAAAPGEHILDAACGTGRYCRLFQSKEAHVVGIDFSEGMLRVARQKMPTVAFRCVDLTGILPFPEASFDKINCAQALKHLPDLTIPLAEFARVLKPSGTITFSVTHPEMDWESYEMSSTLSFNLAAESDIHQHRFWQYFEAIDRAGLRLSAFRQTPVGEKIRKYLTPESYQKVRGRYQIAIFQARKSETANPPAVPDDVSNTL